MSGATLKTVLLAGAAYWLVCLYNSVWLLQLVGVL